jgi:hypothetical protein
MPGGERNPFKSLKFFVTLHTGLDTQLLIKEMNKLCDGNTMTG